MISITDIEKAMNVKIPISHGMREAFQLWNDMFCNKAYWIGSDVTGLNLPASICSEVARITLNDGKSWITSYSNSKRAEFLQKQYSEYMKHIRQDFENACAFGGMVFKPYVDGNKIKINAVPVDNVFPLEFDSSGNITDVIFVDTKQYGKYVFTRLERHTFFASNKTYQVTNTAFLGDNNNSLIRKYDIRHIPEWENLVESIILPNIEKPLFSVFKYPGNNNIDRNSPLGMSCFSKAVDQIKQADTQWALIMWEYNGSQLAVDAPEDMFMRDSNGNLRMPQRMQRLFRTNNFDCNRDVPLKVFSPAIRDQSLFNGFNKILLEIEFNCGLAYGSLSDQKTIEKTAEEVRAGKERSRATAKDIQSALEDSLLHVIWIMNTYADLYKLAPEGDYEAVFEWGEGCNKDIDQEFDKRFRLCSSGCLKKEKFIAWYFGCSEKEALDYLPDAENNFI
ncbi:MAG: phage capsid protein [Oscillospiraceae bacterium]|nr:phage capsid protein [Oscillospiraceae bacterium]